jgi:hypothetical protein
MMPQLAALYVCTAAGGMPLQQSEGLASIMVCTNDTEAKVALKAWSMFGQPATPSGSQPSQVGFQGAAVTSEPSSNGNHLQGCEAVWQYWEQHKPRKVTIQSFFKPRADIQASKVAAAAPPPPPPARTSAGKASGTSVGKAPGAPLSPGAAPSQEQQHVDKRRRVSLEGGQGTDVASGSAAVAAQQELPTSQPSLPHKAPKQQLPQSRERASDSPSAAPVHEHHPHGEGSAAGGAGSGSSRNAFALLMSGSRQLAGAQAVQGAAKQGVPDGEGGGKHPQFPHFAQQQLYLMAMDPSR